MTNLRMTLLFQYSTETAVGGDCLVATG